MLPNHFHVIEVSPSLGTKLSAEVCTWLLLSGVFGLVSVLRNVNTLCHSVIDVGTWHFFFYILTCLTFALMNTLQSQSGFSILLKDTARDQTTNPL